MLIYSSVVHPRLDYILRWMFSWAGEDLRLTTDVEVFKAESGIRIWYSNEDCPTAGAVTFPQVVVLWENEVRALRPAVCYRNNMPFPNLDGKETFDPFASAFFLLTRYEEYAITEFDEHGRFSGHRAWGGAELVRLPLADRWRAEVLEAIQNVFPSFYPSIPLYRTVATIDVDSAFAFRYKGVRRTMGAALLDVFRLKPRRAWRRLACVLSNAHDPFDTYEYILDTCLSRHVELHCFFLLADRSRYDINMDYRNEQLKERIEDMRDGGALVGIHPGYESHNDVRVLMKEIGRLEAILGERVTHSRQHFLKFKLPITYRRLLTCGITHDYTMGYADVPGFRAGTAHPFKWFDVEKNEVTSLQVHPLIVMDSTLRSYCSLDVDGAMRVIADLKAAMRNTGGNFVSLWHNETVAEQGDWIGWRAVWDEAIKQ